MCVAAPFAQRGRIAGDGRGLLLFQPAVQDHAGRLRDLVPAVARGAGQRALAGGVAPGCPREPAARGGGAGRGRIRLVFAPFAPTIEEHLGRLQLADIALDTAPYNSHSTGVDALWCGVPLVCMRGERFAGRVAASLVTAAGVPELAGDTLDDYHRMALALATDADALQAMKGGWKKRAAGPRCSIRRASPAISNRSIGRIWEDHCAGRQEIIRPLG